MPLGNSVSRMGGSTVVVVETSDRARPTSVRVAAAFARANLGDVLLCHWHDLRFLQDVVVASSGIEYAVKGGIVESVTFRGNVEPSVLFFYAPNTGLITARDRVFLERFTATGIDVGGRTAYAVVDRILLEASRRGLVTNAIGPDRRWGPKHYQEFKLRRYEAATGRVVPRPNTHVATSLQVPRLISRFAGRTDLCVIKPAFGDRGHGIEIVSPDDPPAWTIAEDCVVLQDLLSDPLLIDGHKADLRCYLLIDVDNVTASGRRGPILVRRAPAVYERGMVTAEVTNTAHRLRRGMPPDILPLEEAVLIDERLRDAIVSQLEVLLHELTQVYFWDARCLDESTTPQRVPNRVILFGVDVLVTISGSGHPSLYFLEVNPFPGFYRGSIPCDIAIDEMLAREYLPALLSDQGVE
jgi:hypothetical protein